MAASSNLSTLDVSNAIKRLNVEETRELFFQLKVPLKALDDIASQYHDAENRKRHFVQKWLDMTKHASWAKLVAGLRRINMNSLTTEIESVHLSRVPSSGSVSLVPSSALSPPPEARPPAHLETTMKINKAPSECTLHEIRELKESIDEEASLESYAMYIDSPVVGSVCVGLYVPERVGWMVGVVLTPDLFIFISRTMIH